MTLIVNGIHSYRLNLSSTHSPFHSSMRIERESEHVEIIHLILESDKPAVPPVCKIEWTLPIVDIQGLWHPTASKNKGLPPVWGSTFESKSTSSAPIVSLFNAKGTNRLTMACSDVLNVIRYHAGIHEEDSTFRCYFSFFDTPTTPFLRYEAQLRIDKREIPYYDSIQDASQWYETYEINTPIQVPSEALEPMYSSWYSFHQQFTPAAIEEQCLLARELGCKAVIVDDGWQTSDNARGYAYCGDWEVAVDKIQDMAEHVKRVHALGLKYILWYSVPFVGRNSNAWSKYENILLSHNDGLRTGILDPRYPEVRKYIINTYEQAMREWDLDGFKLDFVDSFCQPKEENPNNDPGRDDISVPQAVDLLLSEVINRLQAIKPEVMIEFRQSYISPIMRKYGNMFRAADCPNDVVQNRISTVDIRLLCGNTAVHSDMIMWNPKEPVESAALQLINILFSVPQISVRLDKLPADHLAMLKSWLAFWREHRDVLMHGRFMPHNPELMYPLIEASNESKYIAAVYMDTVVTLVSRLQSQQIIIVNGTHTDRLIIDIVEDIGKRSVAVYNCQGQQVNSQTIDGTCELLALEVPPSGYIYFSS
jgi:alpha-galactosidase